MKIQKTHAGPASTKQTSLKYDVKGRVKICIDFVSFYRNNFHEGDMGNLRQSNAGVIDAELSLPAMVLEGDNGVIGRAVVVSIIVCFCFVLFCFVLFCFVLFCFVLFCFFCFFFCCFVLPFLRNAKVLFFLNLKQGTCIIVITEAWFTGLSIDNKLIKMYKANTIPALKTYYLHIFVL